MAHVNGRNRTLPLFSRFSSSTGFATGELTGRTGAAIIEALEPGVLPVTSVYRFGGFELDCRARELSRDGTPVVMPARCYECLQVLIERRERAVSRDELVGAIFGRHNVSDAQLGQVILRARRVVGDDGQAQHMIRTVPRFGFRWVAETSAVEASPLAQAPAPSRVPREASSPRRPRRLAMAAVWLFAAVLVSMVLVSQVPAWRNHDPERVILQARQDFVAERYARGLAALDHLLETQDIREEDPRLRARALLQRARHEIKLGRQGDAERDFTAAIALLDAGEDPGLVGKALNGRAVARTALGRFDAAQADLRQARALLSRTGDLRSVGWVDANRATVWRRRTGTPDDANGEPDRPPDTFVSHEAGGGSGSEADIVDTFAGPATDDAGLVPPAVASDAVALGELAALHRQLLEWPQAQHYAARAWAMRDRVADSFDRGALAMGLAESLLGSGRLRDAGALLSACTEDPATACDSDHLARLRAELDWRRGDASRALAIVDQALAHPPTDAASGSRRRLVRFSLQLGLETRAPLAGRLAAAWGDGDSLDAWLSRVLVARTEGDEERADVAYRNALGHAEGIPADVVATARSYLPWLIEQGAWADAATLSDRLEPLAAQDYDAAMLQWRLSRAVGDEAGRQAAAGNARRLAGERRLLDVLAGRQPAQTGLPPPALARTSAVQGLAHPMPSTLRDPAQL